MSSGRSKDAEFQELGPLEFWPAADFDPLHHNMDWYHALDPAGLPAQRMHQAQQLPGIQHQQQMAGLPVEQQHPQQQQQAHMVHVHSGNALAGMLPGHDPVRLQHELPAHLSAC